MLPKQNKKIIILSLLLIVIRRMTLDKERRK